MCGNHFQCLLKFTVKTGTRYERQKNEERKSKYQQLTCINKLLISDYKVSTTTLWCYIFFFYHECKFSVHKHVYIHNYTQPTCAPKLQFFHNTINTYSQKNLTFKRCQFFFCMQRMYTIYIITVLEWVIDLNNIISYYVLHLDKLFYTKLFLRHYSTVWIY